MKNDFFFTLTEIVEKVEPDRIIFEPSGIFIPDEILDMLKMPQFSKKCILNSLITVVDSQNYLKQSTKYGFFFERQISNASILILSKTQHISSIVVDEVVNKLRKTNNIAEIITTDWSLLDKENIIQILHRNIKTDIEELLNSDYYSISGNLNSINTYQHSEKFESFGLAALRPFEQNELADVLEKIAQNDYGEVIRGKGFLKSRENHLEFSYVNGQFTISETNSVSSDRISFIGKDLNKNKLKQTFQK